MQNPGELTHQIKHKARQLGFPLIGVTTPDPPQHLGFYREWLAAGYNAGMEWMGSSHSQERRSDPNKILPECQSILVLGSPYPAPHGNTQGGNIAAYALNQDYHHVLGKRLKQLVEHIEECVGAPVPNRWYTDTGPVLERTLGMRAGLGWIGKNTTLINKNCGSYFFLAEILLGIALETDESNTETFCGSCTRCLDTCPTGALVEPYTLDANRCISYLTIEHRGVVPIELRPLMGDWIFGCDICQLVCPWNKPREAETIILEELQPREDLLTLDLARELGLKGKEFSARFKGSPIKRTKRQGYLRNVAIALGNCGEEDAVPVLNKVLEDGEPLVRIHAAWALGQIGGKSALKALRTSLLKEVNPDVKSEISMALDSIPPIDSKETQ